MPERIAAVVTSYNGLQELQGCIRALRAQTRPPDQILVVDGSSTDGSSEWLDAQPDIRVIHQPNLGESGAFRTAHRIVLAENFDWAWCLDDDAHPAPTALQALCDIIPLYPNARVFNSVGMSRTHHNRFAVGALWVRTSRDNYLHGFRAATLADAASYADANGIVDSIGGHFYHGVLLHRTVLASIGSPLPWLFGWGDEIEYGYRIMRGGYHIYSVTGSVVHHPEIPSVLFHFLGRTKEFKLRPPSRHYYFLRNSLWIHRTYFQTPLLPYIVRRVGGAFLAEAASHKTWRQRLAACRAIVRGVRDGIALQPALDADGEPILA